MLVGERYGVAATWGTLRKPPLIKGGAEPPPTTTNMHKLTHPAILVIPQISDCYVRWGHIALWKALF